MYISIGCLLVNVYFCSNHSSSIWKTGLHFHVDFKLKKVIFIFIEIF